jgi:hypothetical protein
LFIEIRSYRCIYWSACSVDCRNMVSIDVVKMD